MNKRDLVSIVVPVFNGEAFLDENIKSILGQSYKNIEIIYICDGCTDQTVSILQSYVCFDTRLRVHVEKENHGAAFSRNLGMKLANGEWIIFLDSDDLFDADMIKIMVERATDVNADMCCCFWEYFDEEPSQKEIISNDNIKLYVAEYPIVFVSKEKRNILQPVFNAPWNKLIHKSIYKKNVLFFQNLPNCDDAYFSSVATIEAKKIVYVDYIFVHYRSDRGRNTLSTSQRNEKNYAWEAYDKIYQYICQKDDNKELIQSFHNKICTYIQGYFVNSSYEDISTINNTYKNFFNDLRYIYFEKWGMKDKNIQKELSYFNWEIYQKVCEGDYRLDRDTLGMLAKKNFVQDIAEKGKCAIWGCGFRGCELLKSLDMDSIRIQHIYDSDPHKWGMYLYGRIVEKYEMDWSDSIIVTSTQYYGEIRGQIGNNAAQIYDLEKDIYTFIVT